MMTNINYELVITEDNVRYVEYEGNYFKISHDSWILLTMLKQKKEIQEIALNLNLEINDISNAIIQIKETLTKHRQPQKIKPLFTCLNDRCCNYLAQRLSFLFQKSILYSLTLISVISILLYYLLFTGNSFTSLRIGFVGYLIALLSIMFIHELGHICAAGHYNLHHLKISLGVYFIWPIFYVNLNGQVLLQREKRIIVSAGGLYFQLLLNLLCIGLNAIYNNDFLTLMINLNIFTLLINMTPLLILDGYWIYADLCRIENLDTKAKALLKIPVSRIRILKEVPFTLLAYAIVRLISILFIYCLVIYYLTTRISYFPDMLYALQENISIGIILRAMGLILPYLLFLTYLSKIIYGRLSKNI